MKYDAVNICVEVQTFLEELAASIFEVEFLELP
jgi:hypothetical protein